MDIFVLWETAGRGMEQATTVVVVATSCRGGRWVEIKTSRRLAVARSDLGAKGELNSGVLRSERRMSNEDARASITARTGAGGGGVVEGGGGMTRLGRPTKRSARASCSAHVGVADIFVLSEMAGRGAGGPVGKLVQLERAFPPFFVDQDAHRRVYHVSHNLISAGPQVPVN